ncbi:exosortase A [Emcibacter sp. SYSU 3D8]|uniref:exosortase A n=1 Tax=Emcibacter sp. SYSU 3D8 TaxID=3133969 RepID=UPI0031FE5D32
MSADPMLRSWSRWRYTVAVFAVSAAALIALFWRTALSMEATWRGNDSYQHTYLVPLILAYLVWEDRDRLARVMPRADWRGLAVVLLAALGWVLGAAGQVQVVQQVALIGMVQGLVLALFGWPVVRVLLFPLMFMLFLAPMGDFLVPTLQRWTADVVVWFVELTGVATTTDGFMITLQDGIQPWHRFQVARECSGIRYLTAMFQIGLLTAYLLYRSWPRRVAAVLVAVAVPIVANWVRAVGIVLIAYHTEGRRGMDVDHIIYGFWFFLFVLAVYIGICWLFAEPPPQRRPAVFSAETAPAGFRRKLAVIGALAVLAGVLAAYSSNIRLAGTAPAGAVLSAPPQAGDWRRTAYMGLDWRPVFAGADEELLARYSKGGTAIDVYMARYLQKTAAGELVGYGNDLAGSGWDSLGERRKATLEVDGEPVTVRYVRLAQPDRKRVVFYWYRVGGGNVSSDVMAKIETTKVRLFYKDSMSGVIAIAIDEDADMATLTAQVQNLVTALSPVSLLGDR